MVSFKNKMAETSFLVSNSPICDIQGGPSPDVRYVPKVVENIHEKRCDSHECIFPPSRLGIGDDSQDIEEDFHSWLEGLLPPVKAAVERGRKMDS